MSLKIKYCGEKKTAFGLSFFIGISINCFVNDL